MTPAENEELAQRVVAAIGNQAIGLEPFLVVHGAGAAFSLPVRVAKVLASAAEVADAALAVVDDGAACPFCAELGRHADDEHEGYACPLAEYEQATRGSGS